MPWWDQQNQQQQNQDEYQKFLVSWAQQQQAFQQQQEAAAQKKDDGGFLGSVFGGLADAGGSLLNTVVGKGSEGLQWYDDNVVRNSWNNLIGPAFMGAQGKEFDDTVRYENLNGVAKFAAGTAADPLSWLPVGAAGSKALRAATEGGRFASLGVGAERAVHGAEVVSNAPFTVAGKGFGLAGKGIKAGVTSALGTTEIGTDILRTMGRPTSAFATRQAGNQTVRAVHALASDIAMRDGLQGPDSVLAPDLHKAIGQAMDKVSHWNKGMAYADSLIDPEEAELVRQGLPVPTMTERAVYDSLHSEGYRDLTKRLWENFRRITTGAARSTGENDLDWADQVIRGFRDEQIDRNSALGILAVNAGDDDLALQILNGTADQKSDRLVAMNDWLDRAGSSLDRRFKPDSRTLELSNTSQYISKLRGEVENQVRSDIESATKAARVFMKDVHFGPLAANTGNFAKSFDPYYERFWKNGFDKWVIQPWSTLTLGFFGFPFSNAAEEAMQSTLGGVGVTKSWGMKLDEMMPLLDQLPSDHALHPSLLEGADGGVASLFGPELEASRELALAGANPSKGLLDTKPFATMRWALKKSNVWSGDIRRNYFIRRYNQYLKGTFPELSGAIDDALKTMGDRAWADKLHTYSNMAVGMLANGKSPEEAAAYVAKNMLERNYEVDKALQLINGSDLHPRAKFFLQNNAAALADPAQRSRVLSKAAQLYMQDVQLNTEALPANMLKWGDMVLENIDQAPTDTLLQLIPQLNDASNTFGQLHRLSTDWSARMALTGGRQAEHAQNLLRHKEIEDALQKFSDSSQKAIAKATSRLEQAGLLTPDGAKQLKELPSLYQKRTQLFKERAEMVANNRRNFLKNRKLESLSDEEYGAFRNSESGVYDRYQSRIDALQQEITKKSQISREHFTGYKQERNAQYQAENVVKAAGVPKEEADAKVMQVKRAIMAGEDPLEALATPIEMFPNKEALTQPAADVSGAAQDQMARRFHNAPEGGQTWAYPQLPEPRSGQGDLTSIAEEVHPDIQAQDMNLAELAYKASKDPAYLDHYNRARETLGLQPIKGISREENESLRLVFTDRALREAVNEDSQVFIHTRRQFQQLNDDDRALYLRSVKKIHRQWTRPVDEEKFTDQLMRQTDPSTWNSNYFEEAGNPSQQLDIQVTGGAAPDTEIHSSPAIDKDIAALPGRTGQEKMSDLTPDERGIVNMARRKNKANWGQEAQNRPPRQKGPTLRPDRVRDEAPYTYVVNDKGQVEAVPTTDWHSIREDNPDWRASDAPLENQEGLRQEYANQLWDEYKTLYKEDPEKALKWVQGLDSHDHDIIQEIAGNNWTQAALDVRPAFSDVRVVEPEKPAIPTARKPFRVDPNSTTEGNAQGLMEEFGQTLHDSMNYREGGLTPEDLHAPMSETEGMGRIDTSSRVLQREAQAREMAREHGVPVEHARKALEEMDQVIARLKNKDPEVLQIVNSVFKNLEDPNAQPYEMLTPFYQDARDKFAEFAQALKFSDEIPALSDKTARGLQQFQQGLADALKKIDPNMARQTSKDAWDLATRDYHRWFTNYDDGRTFHMVMRHFFPFWRYEYQRFPRLGRAIGREPGLFTTFARFMDATGDGSFRVPGTGVNVNPVGGTLYNTLRGLMKDGGYYFRPNQGAWDAWNSLGQATGFIPGPVISIPDAIESGSPGDQMPTAVRTMLETARGYGENIPIVDNTLAASAGQILDTFPSKYRDYQMNQVLASKGIHPYEATEEQKQAALAQVARESAFSAQTGGVADFTTRYVKDVTQQQAQAALAAGVPEDAVRDMIRKGSNPLYAQDDKGVRYLNRAKLRAIETGHPEWNDVAAVRSSFMNPTDQAQEAGRWQQLKGIDKMQADIEAKLKPAYEAFARGEITGKQLLSLRSTAMAQLRGAKQNYANSYPSKTKEKDTSMLPREDQLAEQYWSIEPETNPDGTPNYDTVDMQRNMLLQKAGVTPDELDYIQNQWPKQKFQDPLMTAIEGQYTQASNLRKEYYSIPKYPGVDQATAELGDKGLQLAQQVMAGKPNYTLTQALAVVARADPAMAQAARKVLTIKKKQESASRKGKVTEQLNPRKVFWNANPLLDQFYGQ